MKYASLNNSYHNCHIYYTNRIFLLKHVFRSIDRSLRPTGRLPWINLRRWGFLKFYSLFFFLFQLMRMMMKLLPTATWNCRCKRQRALVQSAQFVSKQNCFKRCRLSAPALLTAPDFLFLYHLKAVELTVSPKWDKEKMRGFSFLLQTKPATRSSYCRTVYIMCKTSKVTVTFFTCQSLKW